ncbi:hypothetical protein PRUPE_1G179000 [Prunus persica]|uniref:Glycosyltransferase n=1 Tax=Prunus persica TaxID=3760 RepID=M5XNT5_PRUPE|nr:hypothetical protein PRUPE_1G179000 [Prunus persica]
MGFEREHIVLLPMIAKGHLIPFLALAKQMQQKTGFTITIATTPLNIQYLQATISSTSSSSNTQSHSNNFDINLAELPFCSSDFGLPPDTENTENLSMKHIGDLCAATVNLEGPARRLILDIIEKEGRPPLCIISDIFFGWATHLAKSLGTENVTFTTCGAYGSAAFMSIWLNLPHRSTALCDGYFTLPGFPDQSRFHISQLDHYLRAAKGTDFWPKFYQSQLSLSTKSFGWLCNTAEEIEPLGLEILRHYFRLPVWSIGPLIPKDALKNSSTSDLRVSRQPAEKCMEWLDSHGSDSVVYISFGSQNTISETQMMELAIGLEKKFRAEWLPPGFEDRMCKSKQGLLVHNWAPQLEILSHKSTGAFVSHCGWNSVLESLNQGVPIIGWPLAAEQAFNSKMLVEEMGVSVELTRGVQSVIVGKEVKRLIDLVMDKGGEGGEMRKKAGAIKAQIRAAIREEAEFKGSSAKAMDDFLETILSARQEHKSIIG